MAHILGNVAALDFATPLGYEPATGYRQAALVDEGGGSLHTFLSLNELDPGGVLPLHLHSYESASFVLAGEGIVQAGDQAARLQPGGYGLSGAGLGHGWRNPGSETLRWLEMSAALPLSDGPPDVRMLEGTVVESAAPVVAGDSAPRPFGHFDSAAMPSAGAIPGLPIAFRGLVDGAMGAELLRTFIIELPPGGEVVLHDHPLEESYFLLQGECEITLADGRHPFPSGSFAWAGVNSPHAFHNTGSQPARWLETQAPQPSRRYSFRDVAAWRRFLTG